MTDLASRAVDLDLRLVGYFVAVAEHRHFGRAAAELRVAQPSLSRQIRRLEQQMGVRLFDRTPQSTRLTEAGEVFLPRAKALLRSAAQATAQARDAAQPGRITIGYTTARIITPVVRALRREHPDADVQTLHLDWNQPRDALLDHRVDAVVCSLPFSTDQLHVTILYDEPRVVLVPLDHRLAGRKSVTIDDIADEPIPKFRDCDPAWNDFWRIDPRPDGRGAPEGPLFDTLEDGLELDRRWAGGCRHDRFSRALATRHHHRPLGRRRTRPCGLGEPRRGPQPSGGGLSQTRRGTPHRPIAELASQATGTDRISAASTMVGADGIEPPTAGV